jgi:arabinofuranosyltransferase
VFDRVGADRGSAESMSDSTLAAVSHGRPEVTIEDSPTARMPVAFRGRPDPLTLSLFAGVAILALVTAWAHRWTSDDGFINVRIVTQIFDGNGPVFNAGERVEAGTSPAWLALLAFGHVLVRWLPIEWVATVLGIAATTLAVLIAQLTGASFYRTRALMPFGILVFLALPPVWDFATSGLETGLSLLWIALSQFALVTAARTGTKRATLVAAFTIGLGPVVRPDFLVMTIVFGTVLFVVTRPHPIREVLWIGAAAVAVPGLYELFRIAYYGALLPNTAYVKESTSANWEQGRRYLEDLLDPYKLWFPLVLLGIVLVLLGSRMSATQRFVLLAPVLAGAAHAFFVVRGGGDFMHARLLLPALFAILLPVAAVPRERFAIALLAPLLLWAVIPIRSGGPPYDTIGAHGIANERRTYVPDASTHPVTISDFASDPAAAALVDAGGRAATAAARGERIMLIDDLEGRHGTIRLDDSVHHPAVITAAQIGMIGVAAGPDVYVADLFSLADPIGSRFRLAGRGRPGHEKNVPMEWMVARFADPSAQVPQQFASTDEVRAARVALRCPVVRDALARASGDLTLARIASNAAHAFSDHGVRLSSDPTAVAASCK